MMPEDEIAEYEKKFEKDRRARLREDKLREQEALQKERVQRALERAQAAPRNQVGRRPVPRSEPPRVKGSFQTKILKNKLKTSAWNVYVFVWMSHPTYVISLSPQAK